MNALGPCSMVSLFGPRGNILARSRLCPDTPVVLPLPGEPQKLQLRFFDVLVFLLISLVPSLSYCVPLVLDTERIPFIPVSVPPFRLPGLVSPPHFSPIRDVRSSVAFFLRRTKLFCLADLLHFTLWRLFCGLVEYPPPPGLDVDIVETASLGGGILRPVQGPAVAILPPADQH